MEKFKLIIAIIIALVLSLYIIPQYLGTDSIKSKKILENNGYKVLEVGGYDYAYHKSLHFNLSKIHTKFKAINTAGDTVQGGVSIGVFKDEIIIYK